MANGAVYIVTQDQRYLDLLLTSAASLKRAMRDLPITVFSQFPVESKLFEKVIRVEGSNDGFYDKTKWIRESPYERTLFVDADIFVTEPFPELFTLLDHFDCAATHEEYLNTDWHNRYPRLDVPICFPEFNTGVLLLKRSTEMDRVLDTWRDLYNKFLETNPRQQINDQPFFRAALYFSGARVATLPREYNCKFRGQGYLKGRVKLLHGHVNFRFHSEQLHRVMEVLNASDRPRVYIAGEVFEQKLVGRLVSQRKAHRSGSFPELPGSILLRRARRLKEILKERGVAGTVARVFAK
jgi:glycosyl transferase family 8